MRMSQPGHHRPLSEQLHLWLRLPHPSLRHERTYRDAGLQPRVRLNARREIHPVIPARPMRLERLEMRAVKNRDVAQRAPFVDEATMSLAVEELLTPAPRVPKA